MTAFETPNTDAETPLKREFRPSSWTIDFMIIVMLSEGYCFPSGRNAWAMTLVLTTHIGLVIILQKLPATIAEVKYYSDLVKLRFRQKSFMYS